MDRNTIIEIAKSCNTSKNDPILDGMFASYNGNPSEEDTPVYYRFLYELSRHTPGLTMMELGCKLGAASLHFLRGGGKSSVGVDVRNLVDMSLFSGLDFTFHHQSSTDPELVKASDKFDIVFVDTNHDYHQTVMEYFLWKDHVKPGGIMMFDDILPAHIGSKKFWDELSGDKVAFPELHAGGWGIGILFM